MTTSSPSASVTDAGFLPAPPIDAPILTPLSPHTPLIHGPKIFGVRPGSPFLYTIPATGDRPMTFSAQGLPPGLILDAATGQITGTLKQEGTVQVTFGAKNALGETSRPFKIVAGDGFVLTPPMGWNSWNCWGASINQDKILAAASAMVETGLIQHGWSYVNVDDKWQGARGGEFNAIQSNPRAFPDFKGLADQIHAMGLKFGLYSTPWEKSYAGGVGGSAENPDGTTDKALMQTHPKQNKKILPLAIGPYHFFSNDAKQWGVWGVDYLKFDWAPNEVPETKEMENALSGSGRDIVLSLSNNTTNNLFDIMGEMSQIANCWRICGDIGDHWSSILSHGFHQDKWAPFQKPGHWNDPDMFQIGVAGGGKPKHLTPDEQYTHVSMWCLLSAPLLLGCDLNHLDPFTLGLITNDEVIDVDQDELGKQALNVSKDGNFEVYAKPLIDSSKAVGLFNLGPAEASVTVKWSDLGVSGKQTVRDLWRQKDVGTFDDSYTAQVASHGVILIRVIPTSP
jgi:alpha-galactosidase